MLELIYRQRGVIISNQVLNSNCKYTSSTFFSRCHNAISRMINVIDLDCRKHILNGPRRTFFAIFRCLLLKHIMLKVNVHYLFNTPCLQMKGAFFRIRFRKLVPGFQTSLPDEMAVQSRHSHRRHFDESRQLAGLTARKQEKADTNFAWPVLAWRGRMLARNW